MTIEKTAHVYIKKGIYISSMSITRVSAGSKKKNRSFFCRCLTSGLKCCFVGYQQCTGVKDDIQKPRYVHNMRTKIRVTSNSGSQSSDETLRD